MHKDLIVAIFVPTTGEGKMPGRVGTGYPVAEDLILTSRHVIESKNRDRQKPIRVRWFHDKPASGESPEWTPLNDHQNPEGQLQVLDQISKFALRKHPDAAN
ncbi:MAG: hypothetical protein R6X17_03235, partial [Candidatus Competibacteraceae bacterium]